MKYRDKNTRIAYNKFITKKYEPKTEENIFKNKIEYDIVLFSKLVEDEFWWMSLTNKEKKEVYIEYCRFNDWYEFDGNTWKRGYTWYDYSSLKIEMPKLKPEEQQFRINVLKNRFFNKSKRRNLIINDILK